jgi:hypothetical protein
MCKRGRIEILRLNGKNRWADGMNSQSVYFNFLQRELLNRQKALQALITHGQTLGNYLERLIREFLEPQIKGHQIGYGQMLFPDGSVSSQLDVIIYDERVASPLFRSGELVVVPSKTVKIVIEVKSIFGIGKGWQELDDYKKKWLPIKEKTAAQVFYLCFDSDKYTLDEFDEKREILIEFGLDGLFILQGRKFPQGETPRGAASDRSINDRELERLVVKISEAL